MLDNTCEKNDFKKDIKIIKSKGSDSNFYVSIKGKCSLCSRYIDKSMEFNCDTNCTDKYSAKNKQKNNCSLSLENEKTFLKLDLLLQFLDQMRHTVISRDLLFDRFRSISERLVKDNMNIQLLMLSDMIIRTQVIQMTKLISKDLCQNKITSPVLVEVFMKQYQLLKSFSIVYHEILSDYESNYLATHNLSFDSLNRAYFKQIVSDCPELYKQIGHFNVTVDQISNNTMPHNVRERIKIDFADLKSDFNDCDKWRGVYETVKKIIDDPDNILKSLVDHSFGKGCHDQRGSCTYLDSVTHGQSDSVYSNILAAISSLADRQSPTKHPDRISNELVPQTNMGLHCGSIYKALESIRPPSISCSSSSTNNSNGYNSCVSISSYEDSSDDEDVALGGVGSGVGVRDADHDMLFQKWKRQCDIDQDEAFLAELRRSPFFEELDQGTCKEINFTTNKRWILREKDRCGSSKNGNNIDEIKQFDKLYEQYLAENEHLIDTTNISTTSTNQMTVPDCLQTLEKADNLQSIIKKLMTKYKKSIDKQEKVSQPPNVCTINTNDSSIFTNEDSSNIGEGKDDEDFEKDFEELSQALSAGSKTREDLEEFEKFLKDRRSMKKGKTHPNLQALVTTCRVNCNKMYKTLNKADYRIRKTQDSKMFPNTEHCLHICRESTRYQTVSCDTIGVDDEESIEELSRVLTLGSKNSDESGDFQSFMERKHSISKTNTRSNVQSAMALCKIERNHSQRRKRIDSDESSDAGHCIHMRHELSKYQTISNGKAGDEESFDLPLDCPSDVVNIEVDSSNISISHNMSSSDTGSGSNSTGNNSSNHKLCNCFNCEMFGETGFSGASGGTGGSVGIGNNILMREKLRNKLAKRKQCEQQMKKSAAIVLLPKHQGNAATEMITSQPDVDKLVEFINGPEKSGCVTPDILRSLPRKNRQRNTKSKPKKLVKAVVDPGNKTNHNKESDYDIHEPRKFSMTKDQCNQPDYQSGHSDNEVDPVVEDFKKFCSNVVIPQQRKKLPLYAALSMFELEKHQGEGVNGDVSRVAP